MERNDKYVYIVWILEDEEYEPRRLAITPDEKESGFLYEYYKELFKYKGYYDIYVSCYLVGEKSYADQQFIAGWQEFLTTGKISNKNRVGSFTQGANEPPEQRYPYTMSTDYSIPSVPLNINAGTITTTEGTGWRLR